MYRDKRRNHKIIVLKPRLEGFLIRIFRAYEVDFLNEMGFKSENNLHNGINSRLPKLEETLRKHFHKIAELKALKIALSS